MTCHFIRNEVFHKYLKDFDNIFERNKECGIFPVFQDFFCFIVGKYFMVIVIDTVKPFCKGSVSW